MRMYIIKRLLLVLPTLLAVGTLVFFLSRMVPGDPTDAIIGQTALSRQDRQLLRNELGLNKPLIPAYFGWWGQVLSGDLGKSVITHLSVRDQLRHRLPVSLELGLLGIVFSVALGIPIGLVAAVRQDSWLDYLCRSISIGFLSIPGFWVAILVIAVASAELGWVPNFHYIPLIDNPARNLVQFAVPALIVGLASSAAIMRMTRSTVLDVVHQEYVQTARAKGLPSRLVLMRHTLPNSLIPVLTIIGLSLSSIVGGIVIFEQIFNLPGMGVYVLEAIQHRDYPVIQAVNLIIALFIVLVNLGVDVSYGWIDPRARGG